MSEQEIYENYTKEYCRKCKHEQKCKQDLRIRIDYTIKCDDYERED